MADSRNELGFASVCSRGLFDDHSPWVDRKEDLDSTLVLSRVSLAIQYTRHITYTKVIDQSLRDIDKRKGERARGTEKQQLADGDTLHHLAGVDVSGRPLCHKTGCRQRGFEGSTDGR